MVSEYSCALKVKKVQYWIRGDLRKSIGSYAFKIPIPITPPEEIVGVEVMCV